MEQQPLRIEAPRWLAEREAAFRASGASPASSRLAATVILLRPRELAPPGAGNFEVYVQRRVATMAFAAGMYAFPGGGVDPADFADGDRADGDNVEAGGAAAGWAARFGLPPEPAGAVVRAAVRELAEEAGVHLDVVALRPWARWLTPEFEPRRYDTFFFVAVLPAGQSAVESAGESDRVAWLAPADALALPMLAPTRFTLTELGTFETVDAVLAAATSKDLTNPVRPVIEVDPDGAWMRLA